MATSGSTYFCFMADVFSKEKRSWIMSRVKSKDTQPELLVRKFLHRQGFRFRLYRKDLPGKPDIILPKYRTAIFVHGCFWHGHKGCSKANLPKTKTEWWKNKIDTNASNDIKNRKRLKKSGWRIIIIWQCDLKAKKIVGTLNKLTRSILR